MAATFRVLLTVDVVTGRTADFEDKWRHSDRLVSGQPANRGHWLGRSPDDDHRYFVVSDWVDESSFRAFEQSPTHLHHRGEMRPYLASGSMQIMDLLPVQSGATA